MYVYVLLDRGANSRSDCMYYIKIEWGIKEQFHREVLQLIRTGSSRSDVDCSQA